MIDEMDDKDEFNVFLVNFVVLLRSWKYNVLSYIFRIIELIYIKINFDNFCEL